MFSMHQLLTLSASKEGDQRQLDHSTFRATIDSC